MQRAALSVVAATEGEGAEAGAVLGWADGRVNSAAVTLQRSGDNEVLVHETDTNGEVTVYNLLPGSYSVNVSRVLSEEERATLAAARPDLAELNAFGGGERLELTETGTSGAITTTAGRPGSLVISEVYHHRPLATSGATLDYNWATFVEVYNNADTTVYLDGKVLGVGLVNIWEDARFPCGSLERWRTADDGIWSRFHFIFPGAGRTFPLESGETAVAAMDAIDHGEFEVGMPDLSAAEFETIGTPDVDNPLVPNMLQAGLEEWDTPLGHGLTYAWGPLFLADVDEVTELPEEDLPLDNPRYRRIAGDMILDVVTLLPTPPMTASLGVEWCEPVIDQRIDRSPSRLLDTRDPTSVQRKILARLPEGRIILQRTHTSGADLERRPRTPGRMP